MVRIGVIGCGAVGGYYGGRLLEAGHDVWFLVRPSKVEALKRAGLSIESPKGDARLKVQAAGDGGEVGPCDLVIVAVKSYDTEAAAALAAPLMGEGSLLLTLQNGVENPGLLVRHFGSRRVLAGACTLEVDAPELGRIVHTSPFDGVSFGPLEEGGGAMAAADAFAGSGVEATVLSDGRAATWGKALFLSPFSAFTTLLRCPMGPIRQEPHALEGMVQMAREIVALARKLRVPLGEGQVERGLTMSSAVPETMTSSMHRDLQKGRRLEVEGVVGALKRCADETGVSAPVTQLTYGMLKVLEFPLGRTAHQ